MDTIDSDYPANISTPGIVAIGATDYGVIDPVGDSDWFKVSLNAGQNYRFTIEAGTINGLFDPQLAVYSAASVLLFQATTGQGFQSKYIDFAPTATADYFLSASGASLVGSYSITTASIATDYSGAYSGAYSGYDSGTWTVTVSTSGIVLGIASSSLTGTYAINGQVSSSGSMIMTAGSVSSGTNFSGLIDSITSTVSGTWTNSSYGISGSFSGSGSLSNLAGNGGAAPINIGSGTVTLVNVVPGTDVINISSGATAIQSLTVASVSYAANTTNNGTLVIYALPSTASTITGSPGNDIITGSSTNDNLAGSAGNDILNGGAGDDIMEGGTGNDTYYVDSTGDSAVETGNVSGSTTLGFRLALDLSGSIDKVIASISYTLGNFLENLDLASGSGNLTGTGNALNNILTGNEGNNTLTGGAGNDSLDGSTGIDSASYTGTRTSFTLAQSGAAFIVTDSTGAEGADTVTNIERLVFADSRIALDITDGNAGTTAKILGAVFGAASVSNTAYVGIGLSLLDSGTSYPDLMLLALNARLGAGFSNADEVNLLYQNLVGVLPSAADLDYWTGTLTSGQFTQASLAVMAADLSLNTTNINLVGLAQTGIEFA